MNKISFPFFILCALLAVPLHASADDAYREELLQKARALNLHDERYWDILLHYQPRGAGRKSLVDDPNFFLSPHGKTDPRAELEADIAMFFFPAPEGTDPLRCEYIARYEWLKERLAIDETRLPGGACAAFDEFVKEADPQSAVLVFPAAHINGPASMFGHTLIRVDGRRESRLVSYAITYAATEVDTNGFLYAAKGLFGFYPGRYTILPYYEKIREYNDIGQRDIWEYNLNLTQPEVRRMLRHAWELRDRYADYYFFDENCSYVLLFLLESARPAAHLTDRFPVSVLPIDTVRWVRREGMVTSLVYRPSLATKILRTEAAFTGDDVRLVKDIAEGKISPEEGLRKPLPKETLAGIADTAADLANYMAAKREITEDEFTKRFIDTLRVRTTLGPAADGMAATPPPPDEGHESGRIGIGFGARGGARFAEFRWRPANHDLLDPDEGYMQGAHIDFLGTTLRAYDGAREERLRLETMDFVNITSLSPFNRFFHPTSWKVNFGLAQAPFADGNEGMTFRLNPGGGLAAQWGTALSYAMVETEIRYGEGYEGRYTLGMGGGVGVLWPVTDRYKIHLRGRALDFWVGDKHKAYEAALEQRLTLGGNAALKLFLNHAKVYGVDRNEALLALDVYF